MHNQMPRACGFDGLSAHLPKPSLCERRLAALGTAVAVIVGLGAFAVPPPVRPIQPAGEPIMLAANDTDTSGQHAPRVLENSAPFSFADLVERVSPAVVTITSETIAAAEGKGSDDIPE